MKKFLFAFAVVFAFLLSGCSDNTDNTNLIAVATTNNTVLPAATEVPDGEKITVTVDLVGSGVDLTALNEDSRSIMPVFCNVTESDIKWYVSFDNGVTYSSELQTDFTYTRYVFDVIAGQEYNLKFKGVCSSEYSTRYYNSSNNQIICTVYYTAEMNNVTFAADSRKGIKVPYIFDHIDMGELDSSVVDYYTTALKKNYYDETTTTGLVAKVNIGVLSSCEYSSVKLVKADNINKILLTDDSNTNTFTFKVDSADDFEPGIYNLVYNYNGMYNDSYYLEELVFSDYDSLYLVKNNYVEATFNPILDEKYYAETIYATMDSSATGDGKTPNDPIYINDAYNYCVSDDVGLRTCNIYCGNDFALDWNALYADETGIFSVDGDGIYNNINQNKLINIITPKAKYVIGWQNYDSEPCLRLYGNSIALKGTGERSVFTIDKLLYTPKTTEYSFQDWPSTALQLRLINGAAFMFKDYLSGDYDASIYVMLDDSSAVDNYYTGAYNYFISKVATATTKCKVVIGDAVDSSVTVGRDLIDPEDENSGYKLYITRP